MKKKWYVTNCMVKLYGKKFVYNVTIFFLKLADIQNFFSNLDIYSKTFTLGHIFI